MTYYSGKIFSDTLREQLQDIVALIRDPMLTNLTRITIKALIVIDVHAKDVVEELMIKRVSNDREFKWLSQMRYYLEEDEAYVRLINATVKYAYEYLGKYIISSISFKLYIKLPNTF